MTLGSALPNAYYYFGSLICYGGRLSLGNLYSV